MSGLEGKLLVARPVVGDPNFSRTVVYMIADGEEGSLGVVLNHPSETGLDIVLADWASLASEPRVVFVGGPVGTESALCLAALSSEIEGAEHVEGEIYMVDLNTDPESVARLSTGMRIFLGYAGWGSGQLDGEIEAQGWFIVEGDAADLFAPEPENIYRNVMRRQRGEEAIIATYPPDPELN